mgnify:CR=1 FL=1
MHFSRRTFALTFAFALALAATPAVASPDSGLFIACSGVPSVVVLSLVT